MRIALKQWLMYGGIFFLLLVGCQEDSCKNVVCQNDGQCIQGTCNCPNGYEGSACEIKSADRFVGSFSPAYDCIAGTQRVEITVNPLNAAELWIDNLHKYTNCTGTVTRLKGDLQTDLFSIYQQTICQSVSLPSGYTISGYGIYDSQTQITIRYKVDYEENGVSHSDSCIVVLTR